MIPAPPPRDACLFLDVDGTLIDIAPTPDAVVVPESLLGSLARAERALGGAVALVSGRSIADLDRLFAPLRLKASGVHGAEFRFGPDEASRWTKAEPIPAETFGALAAVLRDFPASLVENKGYSYAVHYRAAPATGERLRAALEGFLAARPGLGLVIMPGHFVYELKRPAAHKGAAIADFMARAPFAGRRPVFLGDDVTDAPGFAAVREMGGLAYSVGRAFPGVAATFADPAAVRLWLAGLAAPEALTA